jgi:hypothetical protein
MPSPGRGERAVKPPLRFAAPKLTHRSVIGAHKAAGARQPIYGARDRDARPLQQSIGRAATQTRRAARITRNASASAAAAAALRHLARSPI